MSVSCDAEKCFDVKIFKYPEILQLILRIIMSKINAKHKCDKLNRYGSFHFMA